MKKGRFLREKWPEKYVPREKWNTGAQGKHVETLERDFLNWIKSRTFAHLEVSVSRALRINQNPGSFHFYKPDTIGRKTWNKERWLQATPSSQLCVRLSLPFLPSVSGRNWNERCMVMKSWLDADAKMLHDLAPFGVIFLFSINLVTPYTLKHVLKTKGRVRELRVAMWGKWLTFLFPMYVSGPVKIFSLSLLFPKTVSSCSKASLISADLPSHSIFSPSFASAWQLPIRWWQMGPRL